LPYPAWFDDHVLAFVKAGRTSADLSPGFTATSPSIAAQLMLAQGHDQFLGCKVWVQWSGQRRCFSLENKKG